MSKRLLLAVTALLVLGVAPARAETVLSTEQGPFTADAYGDTIAWSSYDPVTKQYRLRVQRAGVQADPAIPTQPNPFDLDVGPSEDGAPTIVYSRCADPGVRTVDGFVTRPSSGCDIWRLDPISGIETRVDAASTAAGEETQPSIHRSLIAFVRTRGGRTRSRSVPHVYAGSLAFGADIVRQPRPPRIASVDGLEQSARGLFIVWRTRPDFSTATLYRVKGRRLQHIFRVGSGGANFGRLLSPSVSGLSVYFGRTNSGSGVGNSFFRYDLGPRRLRVARGTGRANTLTWRGAAFLIATGSGDSCAPTMAAPGVSTCRLVLTDPVTFTRPSRVDLSRTRPPR